jgi:hypothetical protein
MRKRIDGRVERAPLSDALLLEEGADSRVGKDALLLLAVTKCLHTQSNIERHRLREKNSAGSERCERKTHFEDGRRVGASCSRDVIANVNTRGSLCRYKRVNSPRVALSSIPPHEPARADLPHNLQLKTRLLRYSMRFYTG